jgi:hypothetical protein
MWKEGELSSLKECLRIAVKKRCKMLCPVIRYVSELRWRNGGGGFYGIFSRLDQVGNSWNLSRFFNQYSAMFRDLKFIFGYLYKVRSG